MSFDDYANYIYQKHRLAVALAIIKSKPMETPTLQYLEELKSKVDDKMDDDDITVCSDDFLIDDNDDMNDSITILKNYDPDNGVFDNCDNNDQVNDENNAPNILLEDLSQTTFYDGSQTQLAHHVHQNPLQDISLSQIPTQSTPNVDVDLYTDNHTNKSKDVLNKINEPDSEMKDTNENFNNKESNIENRYHKCNTTNKDSTFYDSQQTVMYTVHGFTQNYTHYSPSQSEITIPNKFIYGVDKQNDQRDNANNKEQNNTIDVNNTKTNLQNTSDKIYDELLNDKEFEYSQTMNVFSQNCDNEYDQNQEQFLHHDSHSTETLKHKENLQSNTNTQSVSQYAQNINEYFNEMHNVRGNEKGINLSTKTNELNALQSTALDNTDTSGCTQNVDHIFPNTELYNIVDDSLNKNEFETEQNRPDLDELKNQLMNSGNSIFSKPNNDKEDEIVEYNSAELISYKVLEEFNKVKTLLNRPNRRMSSDGYSSDSGYRSDSQIRNSNRSALQLSGNWINQSGCCLFNYVMQCPLVVATRDITNEIAQVLSQLVDKLHEEERYPSFLEDILETADVLLRQVYEGEGNDSEFLKKDENIQRLLLLSKSIHIQGHCIEKITNILQTFHSKVTEKDSTYELTDIDHIENISYIFHLLEILLKKYLKSKELLSQSSTQSSQDDDKIFKKSSITDIWRKKWNPTQKTFEGSREKKCVLKLCSDVLNKIVVDCVSSYSLVAYSALKCFNSMQS